MDEMKVKEIYREFKGYLDSSNQVREAAGYLSCTDYDVFDAMLRKIDDEKLKEFTQKIEEAMGVQT